MATTYTYLELPFKDSFRVLELLPGTSGSALRCNILHTRRKDEPQYEAISYTWGAPVFSYLLEEASSGTVLHITESLHDALQAFRHEGKSRVVWADAVNINQSDLAEKGHQVRR